VKSRACKQADAKASVDLAEIEEPCRHEIQFGGMCANCGKDMTT
jgi:RNA polymerase II subunit A-like phosphatase